MSLLEVDKLTKSFGGLLAVDEVSFRVEKGDILGLIGPNGSGKSTVINVITGVHRSSGGKIRFRGEEVTDLPPHAVRYKGIARTFQGNRVFSNLSALENVIRGMHCRTRSNLFGAIVRTASTRRELRETEEKAVALLEAIGLAGRKDMPVAALPYGHQSLMGIAIALASSPELLLLDEPMAGMNPQETREMMSFIQRVRDMGIAVLLVEHNMKAIMGVCERIVVLNYGAKIAEGTPAEISRNQDVIQAYLGRSFVAQADAG